MLHIVQGVWEGIEVQAYMFKLRSSNVKAVKVGGESRVRYMSLPMCVQLTPRPYSLNPKAQSQRSKELLS